MSAGPTRSQIENRAAHSAEAPEASNFLDANKSPSIQNGHANATTEPFAAPELRQHDLSAAIVGANSGLRAVMEQVQMVADSDVPVLILGETGSGKEVVARAIHERSERKAGPFLRVNCGAIPSELVDSELFGHERGSFTGASGQRRGWFERADGGTLFLDECGELPLAAQVRLLRILQDGTFMRVGGEDSLHVDVRVIAATHRDLQKMIERKMFRADLWYRLSVFPIRLPPLRERTGDIPALVDHFSTQAAIRFGVAKSTISEPHLNLLIAHPWPGNIRELAATIERAVLLGEGRLLDIPGALGMTNVSNDHSEPASHTAQYSSPEQNSGSNPSIVSLDDAMRAHIENALRSTHGRVDGPFGAAKLLRINSHTLRARMLKLGIDWKQFRRQE
jgi:hydrogenase-4 transcriptional activator